MKMNQNCFLMVGFNHLYLIEIKSGNVLSLTSGEWVLRDVLTIDERQRRVWFTACGLQPNCDPYFLRMIGNFIVID
jgi:hypothetical protein